MTLDITVTDLVCGAGGSSIGAEAAVTPPVILLAVAALIHRLDRTDDTDGRLAWTRCGLRFAWGAVGADLERRRPCQGCAS